jgi:tetratricopeptide (TPR) repeat protein
MVLLSDAQRIQRSLERVIPGSVYVTLFEAMSYRRTATRNFLTMEQREDPTKSPHDAYCRHAEQLFEQAYRMDPQNPMIARERMLLYVETGQAEEAEKWYRLAMAANPDDSDTVQERIDSVRENPSPYFRELLQQENWRARIPFMIIRWHILRSRTYYDYDAKAYYRLPHVREEMQAVYAKYLRVYPNDATMRSWYAKTLMDLENWPEADRQFRLLEKDWAQPVFVTRSAFEAARDKAARMVANPPAPKPADPPQDQ